MSEAINCDRCSGPTKPKEITSKKTGKQYTVYECKSGCMNGQYPYSRFAPRKDGGGGQRSVELLTSILDALNRIEGYLRPHSPSITGSTKTLMPDEMWPPEGM